uniref:Uncharacterized protein n=1 Tax=Arundo donax TaxID=35708 RepID=A0A0A9AH36_ARUDO
MCFSFIVACLINPCMHVLFE